jgi:hypothetical protein
MKKRLMLLLTLAVIVLTLAPAAMADHCNRCRVPTGGVPQCFPATTGGYPLCTATTSGCSFSGSLCSGPHPFIDDDFAADFTVVSVERLDEQPQPRADETRVASLEATPDTTR